MNKMKKILSSILAFLMVLSLVQMPAKVSAAEASSEVKALAGQLITYYNNHQESAQTDIERVIDEMAELDADYAQVWADIMDYWSTVNQPGFANEDTVPEGLPTDDSLAIVILGFALNADGTMKDELVGRLQAGLNVANAYPNAYVVVTGGGTAANNPNVTEGGLMGDWLLEQGLDESRLIRETRAGDTVGNATYTYDILSTTYPSVDSVVIVTSDYHIPRGSILYHSKFLTEAYKTGGRSIKVIDNSGNETGSEGYERLSLQASGLASITGVSAASSVPALSTLVTFEVKYVDGNVVVEATYNNGYVRDVTEYATIENYDPEAGVNQVVSVSYEENGISLATDFNLSQGSITASNYRSNLVPVVEKANAVNVGVLDAASQEMFEPAYEAAQAIMENEYASEEQIKEVLDALNVALDNITTKENVALKKNVIASHNQANAYKVTNGIKTDYFEGLEGGKNIPTTDTEVVIDLYNTYALDVINVVPYYATADRYYQYDVYTSVDNAEWELVAEYRGTDLTTSAGQFFNLETPRTARYIKIKGYYTYVINREDINNIHINEVYAYGEMVEENETPIVVTPKLENVALYADIDSNATAKDYTMTDGVVKNSYGDFASIDGAYATVILPGLCDISSVKVVSYYNNLDKWYNWDVEISTDGEEWEKIGAYDVEGVNPGSAGHTITLEETKQARYVKVKGTASNNRFHLVEIEVMGYYTKNVALNKPVSISKGSGAAKITDGSTSGYWEVPGLPSYCADGAAGWADLLPEDRPYAIINLEGLYALDRVNVLNYRGERHYHYELYTSTDGKEWTMLGAKTDTEFSYVAKTFEAAGVNARFIKFVATKNSSNSGYHLVEMKVSGEKLAEPEADYANVEAALATVPASLEGYSLDSVAVLKAAIKAVDYTKSDYYQEEVDAYATAIEEAVANLSAKPADYTEVNKAIAQAKAKRDYIYDYDAVQEALNAVQTGKAATAQSEVDAYAAALNAALEAAVYLPGKVQNLTATAASYKSIVLAWDADEASTTYVIQRQNSKTGEWIHVATTAETTYTVNGVKTGKEYIYRVKGQKTVEGTLYEGEFSDDAFGSATLVGTPSLTAEKDSDTVFTLNWTAVEGATRYIVYRKANDGEWKKVLTLGKDARSYTSPSMKTGTYAYQIKVARYDGNERIMGEASEVVEVESTVFAPVLDVVKLDETSASLTWSTPTEMKYYEVYRGVNGVVRRVKVTTSTSYVAKNLKAGVSYSFKVRGYNVIDDTRYYSSYSDTIIIE